MHKCLIPLQLAAAGLRTRTKVLNPAKLPV